MSLRTLLYAVLVASLAPDAARAAEIGVHVAAQPDGTRVLTHLVSVFEFEPVGASATRLRVHGVGYRDEPGFAEVMALFEAGNRWSLQQLVKRFQNGPADWPALLNTAPATEENQP